MITDQFGCSSENRKTCPYGVESSLYEAITIYSEMQSVTNGTIGASSFNRTLHHDQTTGEPIVGYLPDLRSSSFIIKEKSLTRL